MFFDHPWVENVQKGGELAFGLASLTAITYPVVSTFQNVVNQSAVLAKHSEVLAKHGEALVNVGEALVNVGEAFA